MGIKCPKYHSNNPDTQRFCGECGTRIIPADDISVSHTKTLQTPVKDLIKGTTFAGRYEIIFLIRLASESQGKIWAD